MATNPVNLVDAVSTVVRRTARNRSGVLRTGVVVSVSGEWCQVRVSAPTTAPDTITAGYMTLAKPRVGAVVGLLNDSDRWLILGEMAGLTSVIGQPYASAFYSGDQPINATATLVPLDNASEISGATFNPVTHLITLTYGGLYHVLMRARAYTREAATVICGATLSTTDGSPWGTARGLGTLALYFDINAWYRYPAGSQVGLQMAANGPVGVGANYISATLALTRIAD